MPSPYYIIETDNFDLTQYAYYFKLEGSVEKDDLVTVKLKNVPREIVESDDLNDGATISYKYGFVGQSFKSGALEIKDTSPTFESNSITVSINGLDKGNRLKKTTNNVVYKHKTLSQIVKKIAGRYKMETNVIETNTVYTEVPQANRTDHELITDLLDKEPKDLQFYVRESVIILREKGLNRTPKKSFIFGNPKSEMISFRPQHKGSSQTGESTQTEATGYNNKDKKPINKESDTGSEENLGKNAYQYDENANLIENGKNKGSGKKIVTGEDNPDDVQNTANNVKNDEKMKNIEANIELNPSLVSYLDEIITMKNVTLKYNGNYHIVTETIDFSGNAMKHKLKAKKDSTSKPISDGAEENESHNSKEGDKDSKEEKTVYEYNENSERV